MKRVTNCTLYLRGESKLHNFDKILLPSSENPNDGPDIDVFWGFIYEANTILIQIEAELLLF